MDMGASDRDRKSAFKCSEKKDLERSSHLCSNNFVVVVDWLL